MIQNARTVNLVIGSLLVITIISVIGILTLLYSGKTVPGEIYSLPMTCSGAISAILASTHSTPNNGQTVQITTSEKTEEPNP